MKREPIQPEPCAWCGEPVLPGDPLSPIKNATEHWECGLRSVVGGLNHQMGACTCCGGTEPPDPPGMTTRQAALAAVGYWHARDLAREAQPSQACRTALGALAECIDHLEKHEAALVAGSLRGLSSRFAERAGVKIE